jgi:methionyl-tRNA formyltransferase
MNILLLGPPNDLMISFLNSRGEKCSSCEGKILVTSELLDEVDFIVSYGYRHIIDSEVIKRFHKKIINLHISYLPWNRGADPNLWSHLGDTPKGVSIHFVDEGIDTGDLIVQQRIESKSDDTLRSSYNCLVEAVEKLFMKEWPEICSGQRDGKPQSGKGTYHRRADLKTVKRLLTQGWDTPVKELVENYKILNRC